MSDLKDALTIANDKAVFSLGNWWLDCKHLNKLQKQALVAKGWKIKRLMSTWLIPPEDWEPIKN